MEGRRQSQGARAEMTDADVKRPITRPWNEVEAYYRDLTGTAGGAGARGMLHLVEQINRSRYARALHPWTSMLELCIVQVPCTYPYDGPYLRISPRGGGTIEFRYIDTHIESRQWHRTVEEEDAFRRLERFIDQLRWVAGEKKHDA
jgi:hypothetical protein